MTSTDNNIPDNTDNDETDSQELFESFMEITKHAETELGTEANGAEEHRLDTTNALRVETENGSCAAEEPSNNFVDENQIESNSSNSMNVPSEEEAVNKRLSKAVDELSDLEKQLSLMISTGSISSNETMKENKCLKDDESDTAEADREQTSEHEKSGDDRSSSKAADEPAITSVTDDVFLPDNKDSENINTPIKETTSCNTNEFHYEVPNLVVSQNNENRIISGTNKDGAESEQKTSPIDKNVNEETENASSGLVQNQIQDDVGEHENEVNTANHTRTDIEEDNQSIVGSVPSNDKQLQLVDMNQCQEATNDTPMGNSHPEKDIDNPTIITTQTSENPQLDNTKQGEEATNYTPAGISQSEKDDDEDFIATTQAENRPPGLTANETEPSTPDIEILMTDESGISERKSLDSLDADLDNEKRPESPALSDEGIDSDARSLDDLDVEDDTFESGSTSDLASNHLYVDRNRFGSNSSTVSEREFSKSGEFKQDAESEAQIYMMGHLLKLGGSGLTPKNWRKRWFVLKEDNCLYYYKHSKDKVPCGVIVLFNYSVTKAPDSSKKCCFKLNKGGARTYHFCANSDDDMRKWMVALMKAASAETATGTSFQILEGNVHNVSIPALSIKDPECHGYLSKQGHGIKTWKRRYCVLKNGYLYYYSDMSNTTALGVAKLLGYQIKSGETRGKHFCFYGSPPHESMRVYHFSAETENDRERWMKRMEESIDRGNAS